MLNKVKKVIGDKIVLVNPALETHKNSYGLVEAQVLTNVGIIKFIGAEIQQRAQELGLEVGQKVVYASQTEQLEIENVPSLITKLENIIAILE